MNRRTVIQIIFVGKIGMTDLTRVLENIDGVTILECVYFESRDTTSVEYRVDRPVDSPYRELISECLPYLWMEISRVNRVFVNFTDAPADTSTPF